MALAAPAFDDSSVGLVLAVAGGAIGAISATLLWMRLLRRSPELREVLQVTEEGVPVAAVEELPVEELPVEELPVKELPVEGGRRGSKGVEEGEL
jgi:hypothetical protein